MNIHSRARLTPARRVELAQRVRLAAWPEGQAASAAGVSTQTVRKWVRRYDEGGIEALRDRSSRPARMPRLTPPERSDLIVRLRRCRLSGPAIAKALRMPPSTVAAVLQRAGLSRLKNLAPPQPVQRYERSQAGELLHIDVKKLGRFERVGHRITGNRRHTTRHVGWEFVHVAIDDYSRLAYVEVLANERADTAIGFLERALAFYRRHGVSVKQVMSDNGSAYISRNFASACQRFRLRHLRTQPYTPRTNGKAERFIQTMLREWAYVIPYNSSVLRARSLPSWTAYYNRRRPHAGLNGMPPLSRIERRRNNVSGNNS
jgi:transposase InsO family protein